MNISKSYRLVVAIGESKGRKSYRTIGLMHETDTGPIIFIDRHVNLAALPSDSGSILISVYEKDKPDNESF